MSYIGNTIRAADDYRLIDDISGSFNGSTTSFALQVSGSAPVPFPKSPQQVLISVNGVIQEPDPTGSSGFNLVGTNIVFSSAPTNGHAFFGIIYATADYLNAGGNFPSGSLGAPSITFVSDENTGIYRKGSGSVAFVADATEIANTDSNGLTISSGNLILGDSSGASDDRIKLGASGDLQIYHDGSNTRIANSTGDLKLQGGGDDILLQPVDTEIALKAVPNGAVELYFDNAKKAETVTGGFTVTGVCTATSFAGDGSNLTGVTSVGGDTGVDFNDGVKARFGTGNDLVIEHDGSNSYISDGGTGDLIITGSVVRLKSANTVEDMIKATENGAVQLYHDNSEKLATSATGATVTGTLSATKLTCDDNADTAMDGSASGQLQIGGNGYTAAIALDSSNMNIYHNASGRGMLFGINETAVAKFDTSGHFLPATNNTFNLGSSSLRWANIFTNDLNLSNEGSSNDVDGTWGDWTIQEGESDLFLKNNRSGKKYKFNLTEVS